MTAHRRPHSSRYSRRTVSRHPRQSPLALALRDGLANVNEGPPNPHDPGTVEHAEWAYEHRVQLELPVAQSQDNPRALTGHPNHGHTSDDWYDASATTGTIGSDYRKVCTKCGKSKAATSFYRQRYGDGLTADCRACRADRATARYYAKQEATRGLQ